MIVYIQSFISSNFAILLIVLLHQNIVNIVTKKQMQLNSISGLLELNSTAPGCYVCNS